jgi:hypothetical protein
MTLDCLEGFPAEFTEENLNRETVSAVHWPTATALAGAQTQPNRLDCRQH